MSRKNIGHDLKLVLNGFLKVTNSSVAIQKSKCETALKNSSIPSAVTSFPNHFKQVG